MKNYQSILFDLDGTLLDTAPDRVAALNSVLLAHGEPVLALEAARPYVSRGARGLLQRGFGLREDAPDYASYVEEFIGFYRKALCEQTTLFDGMSELLHHLDEANCPWGVVTNKVTSLSEPLLRQINLYDRMQVLVCGDTLAEKKPSARPLLHACDLAGMRPEQCIYAGDDPRDIQAANAAGMLSVAVRYGYYDKSDPPDDWGADIVIDHPRELAPLLGITRA